MRLVCYGFIFCLFFGVSVKAEDSILKWVNDSSAQSKNNKISAWNPGLLPFDETQIRADIDDKGYSNEQSLRLSLKPLGGLSNEFKLSKQRAKLLDLEVNGFQQDRKLQSYRLILNIWMIQKSLEVISKSESLFNKAKRSLKTVGKQQSINFDLTQFLTNIANFTKFKTILISNDAEMFELLSESESENKSLVVAASNIQFLSLVKINKMIDEGGNVNSFSGIERERKQLKYYEFQKKKHEAYQTFKFVSVSREERGWRNDEYKFQLALRIPFLSDSQELERAKTDYILESGKFEKAKVARVREVKQLKTQIRGLIAEAKILSLLPSKSLNNQKLAKSLSSISSAVDNESNFVKAKLKLIETQYLIFEKYLFLLSLNNGLNSSSINYLVTLPKKQ